LLWVKSWIAAPAELRGSVLTQVIGSVAPVTIAPGGGGWTQATASAGEGDVTAASRRVEMSAVQPSSAVRRVELALAEKRCAV
jgi:hypothetical protein